MSIHYKTAALDLLGRMTTNSSVDDVLSGMNMGSVRQMLELTDQAKRARLLLGADSAFRVDKNTLDRMNLLNWSATEKLSDVVKSLSANSPLDQFREEKLHALSQIDVSSLSAFARLKEDALRWTLPSTMLPFAAMAASASAAENLTLGGILGSEINESLRCALAQAMKPNELRLTVGDLSLARELESLALPRIHALMNALDANPSKSTVGLFDASSVIAESQEGIREVIDELYQAVNEILVRSDPSGSTRSSEAWLAVKLLIFTSLLTILLFVLNPFWDYYVKECVLKGTYACAADRTAEKQVKTLIEAVNPLPSYKASRRIIGIEMVAHMNPKFRSPTAGNVARGSLVVVLEPGLDWTQIEFDDGPVRKAGWVYTRYLKKL